MAGYRDLVEPRASAGPLVGGDGPGVSGCWAWGPRAGVGLLVGRVGVHGVLELVLACWWEEQVLM